MGKSVGVILTTTISTPWVPGQVYFGSIPKGETAMLERAYVESLHGVSPAGMGAGCQQTMPLFYRATCFWSWET